MQNNNKRRGFPLAVRRKLAMAERFEMFVSSARVLVAALEAKIQTGEMWSAQRDLVAFAAYARAEDRDLLQVREVRERLGLV